MKFLLGAAAALALSACAPTPHIAGTAPIPYTQESIANSVGPCFGFCPVYTVSVAPDGTTIFDGTRHTALLGRKLGGVGPAAYARLATSLAAYRPATGTTTRTICDAEASDLSDYHIVWTAPDGTRTMLDHNKGCRSARNTALNALLDEAPQTLGIADVSAQTTRPGASRG